MTTIEDLPSELIAQALRHMDGPTLTAASCSAPLLRSLSADPDLWRNLCLSTWPSLRHPRLLSLLSDDPSPGAHRRFFSRSFPFPSLPSDDAAAAKDRKNAKDNTALNSDINLPTELISAIDLYHQGIPVFSRVVELETSSAWFLTSPFRVDGLDRKDPDAPYSATADEPAINPEDLTLSWVMIDPGTRQAVNISSRKPVAVDRHWYTGETLVRFAVVLKGCAVSVVVACGEELGHVREVTLTMEDMDGVSASGRDSLVILTAAMEGGRRGVKWEMEVKGRYEEYLKRKRERRETKVRREGMMDLCCTAFGGLMFLSFLMLLAFR